MERIPCTEACGLKIVLGGHMEEFGKIENEACRSILDRLQQFSHRGWEVSQVRDDMHLDKAVHGILYEE